MIFCFGQICTRLLSPSYCSGVISAPVRHNTKMGLTKWGGDKAACNFDGALSFLLDWLECIRKVTQDYAITNQMRDAGLTGFTTGQLQHAKLSLQHCPLFLVFALSSKVRGWLHASWIGCLPKNSPKLCLSRRHLNRLIQRYAKRFTKSP